MIFVFCFSLLRGECLLSIHLPFFLVVVLLFVALFVLSFLLLRPLIVPQHQKLHLCL